MGTQASGERHRTPPGCVPGGALWKSCSPRDLLPRQGKGDPPKPAPPSPAADPAHLAALPRHLSPHGATPRGCFTWGGLFRGKMAAKSLPWAPVWLQQDLGFPQCHLQWDNWEPAKDPLAPMDGLRRRWAQPRWLSSCKHPAPRNTSTSLTSPLGAGWCFLSEELQLARFPLLALFLLGVALCRVSPTMGVSLCSGGCFATAP